MAGVLWAALTVVLGLLLPAAPASAAALPAVELASGHHPRDPRGWAGRSAQGETVRDFSFLTRA